MSTWNSWLTLHNLLAASALIRIALIVYSEWHDAHAVVKYTDVDYRVFSDATRFLLHPGDGNIAQGVVGRLFSIGDPYTRETYRYTPLLALLLTPNEWLHPAFGKCLFAMCDLVAGVIIYNILVYHVLPREGGVAGSSGSNSKLNEPPEDEQPTESHTLTLHQRATLLAATHLLNPLVFGISTRGSSESILLLLVLLALRAACSGRWDAAACLIGVGTHWKIYPVVYGVACVCTLGAREQGVRRLLNGSSIRFGVIAAGTFGLLGAAMYAVWGHPFLYESYLYHLHRRDHRHNFAPHFHALYLSYPAFNSANTPLDPSSSLESLPVWTRIIRSPLASFVPQLGATISAGWLFGTHPDNFPLAWFAQTFTFVVLNKVCTSQYFLWYMVFVPLLLPRLQRTISFYQAAAMVGIWVGTQALWLSTAYRLEFMGENVVVSLWVCGLVYVLGNSWVLGNIVQRYAM